MNTSGFYKAAQGEDLLYAPIFVQSATYTLLRSDRENYLYPIDGWRWFSSKDAAYQYHQIVRDSNAEIEISANYIPAKWASWRQEMASLPSFQLLFQLIDGAENNGAKSAWAYLVALLFRVGEEESLVNEIAALWGTISESADIHQDTKDYWAAIAQKHDLPEAFVEGIRA
jgi:hypothetical protein